jgi:hypothetical protein
MRRKRCRARATFRFLARRRAKRRNADPLGLVALARIAERR